MSILPNVGDPAPLFHTSTQKGELLFPEFSTGCWCVFFAHPANFTSAWTMYSSYLALKERWFTDRNTKLLALSNEPLRQNNDWHGKMSRYIGIYWKAPIVEDPDFTISNLYGMASGRRHLPGFDRLIFIIDPQGIIRMIIQRPLPSIENAIIDLERELDRLQGVYIEPALPVLEPHQLPSISETPDVPRNSKPKPAYFSRKKLNLN